LYFVCVLTDFAAFMVIFAVSRGLAEEAGEPWYLGVVGGGLSFSAGVGSLVGGWLAHRFDGRAVFLFGAASIVVSAAVCRAGDPANAWFLPGYWLLGIGLGFLYPPLIGWLNQGEDAHANRHGVSRTLVRFCIAWNVGMMCGQLSAGSLFAIGPQWTYGAALAVSLGNLGLALVAARRVSRLPPAVAEEATSQPELAEIAANFKRLSWLANLGCMFGGSLVVHLLPDLAVAIGVSADRHGWLLALWRGVIIATYVVLHQATFWHYRFSASVATQLLAAAGLVVIALADSSVTLLVGLALLGQLVGFNYFSGLFYSTAGSSQTRRALAAGIHEATLAAGMAVGTIVGGMLGTLVNHRTPYLLAAGVLVVLLVVQSVAWRSWVRPLISSAAEPSTNADAAATASVLARP
jgi:MFS family permease